MKKRVIAIALTLCFFLVLIIAPTEVKALSYTDTEYDFQTWAQDINPGEDPDDRMTLTNGFIQDCEDDLDGTDGWDKTTNGVISLDTSNLYEGTNSANISSTSGTGGASKQYNIPTDSFTNCWLAIWLDGSQNSDNEGYMYLTIEPYTSYGVGGAGDKMQYVLANSTTFSNEFNNESRTVGFSNDDKTITTQGIWQDAAIRLGDCNSTGTYYVRNVTDDFYQSRNLVLNANSYSRMQMKLYTKENYILNLDVLLVSINEGTIEPLPEPQVTGNAKGFYNESGLCLETGASESAYAQIDFNDFADKWDYGVKVTYSGTGTSTNISSSLNVDAVGWSDWNHTIATLGNDTFMYYTTNQSYDGEDIHGRYVNIDCPASSTIIIQSLTFRTGTPSGGGGLFGGGGGGGEAPATITTEVVSELTTPLIFGITYAHLLLIGMLGVVFARPYVKKKVHYRVPKQNLVFISGLSFIFIVFFWISLSAVYMESPAENVSEIFFPFYLIGLFGPAIVIFGTYRMKMQGVEKPPNKFIFQSKEFGSSVIKGTILLTSVSFVLYYILNLITGFRADVFLVTQLPTQSIFAFQLGSSTIFFLHFVLPWVEEMCFRFLLPLMVAPYITDETQRAIISSATFGAFHFYVAQTIGYAYFIYFTAGGFIFYSICYGTMWLEKYWKSMPSVLRFKGAGIMAAIIVHLVFNFMALYGSSLLQTAWVVEI